MAIHRSSDLWPASHSWPKKTPYKKVQAQACDSDNSSVGPSTSGSNINSQSTALQPIPPAKPPVERNPSITPPNPTSSYAIQSKAKKLILQPKAFNSRSTISGPSMAFLNGASEPTIQHSLPSAKHSGDRSSSPRSSIFSTNSASKSTVQRSGTLDMDIGKGVERLKPSTPKKPQAGCRTSNNGGISEMATYNIRLQGALDRANMKLNKFQELGGEEAFNRLYAQNVQLRLQVDEGQATIEKRVQEKIMELQRQFDEAQAKLTVPQATIESMVAARKARLERGEMDLRRAQADLERQKTATRGWVRKATERLKEELRGVKTQLASERASTEAKIVWGTANLRNRLQQAEASLGRNRARVASLQNQLQETQFQLAEENAMMAAAELQQIRDETAAKTKTNAAMARLEERLKEAQTQITQSHTRAVELQKSLWIAEAEKTKNSKKRFWDDVSDEGMKKRFRGEGNQRKNI